MCSRLVNGAGPVPRFFFHVQDGVCSSDTEGTLLPDLASARTEAVKLSGAMISECDGAFWSGEPWTLTVEDDQGLALFMLYFGATASAAGQTGR